MASILSLLTSHVGRLRIISAIEGVSFLVLLFIAMPLKYIWQQPETVRVVGFIHGGLVLLFIPLLFIAYSAHEWSVKKMLILLFLSFLPFGNFYADKKYLRS